MAIRINLKPFPGAEYFTVKEHRRAFNPDLVYDYNEYQREVIELLRQLHGISPDFHGAFFREEQLIKYLANFNKVVIKDNPVNGLDELSEDKPELISGALLNLSFSFPASLKNAEEFGAILIDPRASLGIPVEVACLFSKGGDSEASSILNGFEVFLMDHVIHDISNKGLDVIRREANYKAAVLYQLIEDCTHLMSEVDKKNRSKTMIQAKCERSFADKIVKIGYEVGITGNGNNVNIIIANYATHSKEMMELFSDRLMAL